MLSGIFELTLQPNLWYTSDRWLLRGLEDHSLDTTSSAVFVNAFRHTMMGSLMTTGVIAEIAVQHCISRIFIF